MSDLWLNIRVLRWHLQIQVGSVVPRVTKNTFISDEFVQAKPVQVCQFEPRLMFGW